MRRNGFSLVEVLVAMMILSGALILIANSWTGNAQRLEKARVNNTLALLLQQKMTEIEIEFRDKSIDEIDEEKAGEFEKFPQFKWQMKSQKMEFPDMSSALTSRKGGADELLIQMVKAVAEYINKSVKEVTVTVLYKRNAKSREIKNSITTYFVDYSKEIPIGPGGVGGSSNNGSNNNSGSGTGNTGGTGGGTP